MSFAIETAAHPLKVQLIHPPAFLNPTALTALRPSLPLGLAYVAASIRQAGHDVSVIDAVGEAPDTIVRDGRVARLGLTVAEIVAALDDDTHVVGVSAMFTYQWRLVAELLNEIKKARPDILLLGGGEHFTGLPDASLEESEVDVLVVGEGEESIVDLVRRYGEWLEANGRPADPRDSIPDWLDDMSGVCYRSKSGEHVHNPRRGRVREVDEIPTPAWDLFDVKGYDERGLVNGLHNGITMPILATRGCPYQCAYCSSPNMWTTRWTPREPKLVADEIQYYVETYGATNFPFHDLTAIMKKKWIVEFCTELIDRGLDIRWQLPSGTRCEVVDDEVAELLRKSGGLSLNFAPESGSEAVRKKIAKQMKADTLFKAVGSARKFKLNTSCFFVLGFPGDQVEDFRETLKWAKQLARLGVDDLAVGFYFPIPGTRFYREMLEGGKVEVTDDLLMAPIFVHDRWMTDERNFSDGLSSKTLTIWRYKIVWAFYWRAVLTNPKRIFRVFTNFLKGQEESKFDSFLQILKDRFFTRRAKKVTPSS